MLEVIKLELSLWKLSKWLPDWLGLLEGGRGGQTAAKGRECHQRPVFTNNPLTHQTGGHQRPLAPSSAAPTTVTCMEPGYTLSRAP